MYWELLFTQIFFIFLLSRAVCSRRNLFPVVGHHTNDPVDLFQPLRRPARHCRGSCLAVTFVLRLVTQHIVVV
jgi:hypothetical protein